MHRSSNFAIAAALLASTAFFAGCAKKQVMAPPPPAPALAQAPTVQTAPPAPPTSSTASAQTQLKDLLAQVLNPIYFDYNQSKVKPAGEEILAKIGQILKAHPELDLDIEGNTDQRGSTEYNLALGERRAHAASQWLVAYGVKKSQLKDISYGKEHPVAQGNDESAWSKNRRDEFKPL